MAERSFGRWLQRHMDRHRWNQTELARRAGMSTSAVSDWVRDERVPDPVSVATIARTLDASIEEAFRVLGWFDEPTALTPAQADLIETIRRRNISDTVATTALAMIVQMDEAMKAMESRE